MAIKITDDLSEAPKAEDATPVEISLIAHDRYNFRAVLFERKDTYKVTPDTAKVLLAQRTEVGSPIFVRTANLKKAAIPEELQGPKMVNLTTKGTLLAGMSDAVAKSAFNVLSTPEEEAAMNADIAERAAAEEAAEAKAAAGTDAVEV